MVDPSSAAPLGRARRVGAEHVFELARHLTERDREVALCLYEQQLLTTEQLLLLFFSSKRRAQDRLLFLYRQRVLDRFYPPSRFGAGKPQAHWLLDEAGAQLVAAALGRERKRLAWQRRDDWRSHPQLAHRLELNRFVTDLVAATLPEPTLGVSAWYGPRRAAARLGERVYGLVRPDSELLLLTARGPVDLLVEWDRGSETQERLAEKLRRYRLAERKLRHEDPQPRSVLFVVPGPRRLRTLHETAAATLEGEGRWPLVAVSASELGRAGALAPLWRRLDRDAPACSLTELPFRTDLDGVDPNLALGRRWRHDHPSFWQRLSPLGRPLEPAPHETRELAEAASEPAPPRASDAPNRTGAMSAPAAAGSEDPPSSNSLLAGRRRLEREMRDDAAAASAAGRLGGRKTDLPLSGLDGSMDDPEAKEERWR